MQACEYYLVTSVDGEWSYNKKFHGPGLQQTSYKVKHLECMRVPFTVDETPRRHPSYDAENEPAL